MTVTRKILILIISCITFLPEVYCQLAEDRSVIISKTDVQKLREISKRHNEVYLKNISKSGNNIAQQITDRNGNTGYLSGFDKIGNPVYDFDDNYNAATSIKTYRLWVGGSSGLDLDGADIEIGHWEAGGLALRSHQEFDDRVTHADSEEITTHATHTACTMIGSGVKPLARGMAPAATIISNRSNNDESEVADFAADGGIISNHSYSTGNPDGNTPDYGIYTENSAEWDEILYYGPYLLVCKSASNDRNDDVNPQDNGYDILYTVALSKNTLTIGAVEDVEFYTGPSSVTQSAFTSWGPSDDWRIKPDITANGVGVYSADKKNNAAYETMSGTSMSSPSIAGSVALLQQHYHNLFNAYMKSATVKALLLCTTDEVGDNDGPDFQSGWGLMNTERAAYVISNNGPLSFISEFTLLDSETITGEIEVDGTSSLSLAIAWTDPPGVPVLTYDTRTPMLINDLDVRISGNGAVYEPWLMEPNLSSNNFTDPAIKGDNYRDNVERIDIANISAGTYTVTVSHKGNLVNESQDFSMVAMGLSNNTLSVSDQEYPNKSVWIYPVPIGEGNLNIRIPEGLNSGEYEINLFDIFGRKVKSKISYDNHEELDVSGLSPGLYIIRIKTDKSDFTRRIVVN